MIHKIRNIETGFRLIRVVCIWFLIGCSTVTIVIIHRGAALLQTSRDKVYVIASGKIMDAFASSAKDNLPVEARDHIKTFHEKFFTLDPDEKAIQYNLRRALYLADNSAKREYDNLQ